METKITLWEVLIPTMIGDKPVRTRYHKVWDEKVRSISGGLTIMKPVKGEWISSDGELYAGRSIPVRVACTEEDIDKIMDITLEHYEQLEVMAYKISSDVKFRKREEV